MKRKQIEDENCFRITKLLWELEALGWVIWFHPPNEGKKKVQYAAKLKKMGLRAGVPDYWIGLDGGKSFFVEVKTATGTLTESQKIYIPKLEAKGYPVHVVKTDCPKEASKMVFDIIEKERA